MTMQLLIYYSLTLIFYIFEILLFKTIYPLWDFDIFWLNALLRFTLVIFFSITVRRILFRDSNYFYLKFLILIILNPIVASFMLKGLTEFYLVADILILKFISDLVSSLIFYITLKKIT